MRITNILQYRRWWYRIPRLVALYAAVTVISIICLLHHQLHDGYEEDEQQLILGEPMPLQDALYIGNSNVEQHKIRIMCLIVTTPKHHSDRAIHVAATWARHCDHSVFLTTKPDKRLPEVVITTGATTYKQLWEKVTSGFLWAYGHMNDWDWVVKVDDDSFLLVENLRKALVGLDTREPLATGMHFTSGASNNVYLQGGAGYVLSRGAVTQLVERGLHEHMCKRLHLGTAEDVNMGRCLKYLGVRFLDSRDSEGHQRFHVLPPQELVDPRRAKRWRHFWLSRYPIQFGLANMSKHVISFHHVDADSMYLIYYLVYYLNPLQNA